MDVSIMPLPVKFERNDMKYIYFCEEHKFITRTAVLKMQGKIFPHSIKYHFPCGNPVVCPTPRATILPQFNPTG
jgi:hypothetical protein